MTDLSKKTGNPTSALQGAYQDLMKLKTAGELFDAAIAVVNGSGISANNRAKFVRIAGGLKNDLAKLQGYVTNFLLSGSGLAVIGSRR